ncbi:hypothetical protein F5Y19DRAFT_478235 [Xylariaceae sp. FL1651]|nr:hypothetical protein F5Y19DRAFT_478235 [Xylariaceae sp. FL1651]
MSYFFSSGSTQEPPPRQPVREAGSFYFAYGSNLHLAQMANRCPASVFKGKAILSGYRWQINQRGVANVVASPDDSVEGLIYLVTPKDERALDRSEGVSKGFYQKRLCKVDFEAHGQYTDFESFRVAQLISPPDTSEESKDEASQSSRALSQGSTPKSLTDRDTHSMKSDYAQGQQKSNHRQEVKALVYISENYTTNGKIREEYILRLQMAAFDAIALGVSRYFVDKYITPFLDGRNVALVTPRPTKGKQKSKPASSEPTNGLTTGSESKRPRASQKDETKRTYEFKPKAAILVFSRGMDLDELKISNRSPHATSGLEFPEDVLICEK